MTIRDTVTTEALKAAPPLSVAGFTGNEILIAISIVYVVLQIAHLIWKWNKERVSAAFERAVRKPEEQDDGNSK